MNAVSITINYTLKQNNVSVSDNVVDISTCERVTESVYLEQK